jgi:hypothetical protein
MVEVRIYVEGGGDTNDTLTRCREGFRKFFDKLLGDCSKPKVIACGGRKKAFDLWQQNLNVPGVFCILLVDSEEPVQDGKGPWQHLAQRKGDGWSKPPGITDDHCHLIVPCMEAWLIADVQALAAYYNGGFNAKKLPQQRNIEEIPKEDLYKKLADATRATKKKGTYGKGAHSFDLLGLIDPGKVEERSARHMARLAEVLRKKLCKGKRAAPVKPQRPARSRGTAAQGLDKRPRRL